MTGAAGYVVHIGGVESPVRLIATLTDGYSAGARNRILNGQEGHCQFVFTTILPRQCTFSIAPRAGDDVRWRSFR